jgi:hypothetical protein
MGKHGFQPFKQLAIIDALDDMFGSTKTWSVSDAMSELGRRGLTASPMTMRKARRSLGIRSERAHVVGVNGISHWVWTIEPPASRSE